MAIEMFSHFCLGKFYNLPKWIRLSVVLNAVHVMLVHFTIENIKHNPPKSIAFEIVFLFAF